VASVAGTGGGQPLELRPIACTTMDEGAPGWLSYASAAMSFIALIFTGATYRRQGARVTARYVRLQPTSGPVQCTLTLYNSSNSAISIERIELAASRRSGAVQNGILVLNGPAVPFSLVAYSMKNWTVEVRSIYSDSRPNGMPRKHKMFIQLGNVRKVRARYKRG
jgi:hypothetical protein